MSNCTKIFRITGNETMQNTAKHLKTARERQQ